MRLHWQVFAAMIIGISIGLTPVGDTVAAYTGWLGTLFMRLLRMIIVPLVITSIISGVASAGSGRTVGRMFGKTIGYYLVSSLLAAVTGLILFNIFNPGRGYPVTDTGMEPPDLATPESPVDLLFTIVPDNFLEAATAGDMLMVIFFCILFGVAVTTLPQGPRDKITGLVDALFKAMMSLTTGIIKLLPIGVFGLMVTLVGQTGLQAFGNLGQYVAALGSGLAIHFFITLPLLLYFWARVSPWTHFLNMREPLLVAFSTSSSAATLPVTMKTVREKVGVSRRVTSFTLPMGATVNMDGTAVMECVGALFIAQALGADIGFLTQVVVVLDGAARFDRRRGGSIRGTGGDLHHPRRDRNRRQSRGDADRRRDALHRPAPRHGPHRGQRLQRLVRGGGGRQMGGRTGDRRGGTRVGSAGWAGPASADRKGEARPQGQVIHSVTRRTTNPSVPRVTRTPECLPVWPGDR